MTDRRRREEEEKKTERREREKEREREREREREEKRRERENGVAIRRPFVVVVLLAKRHSVRAAQGRKSKNELQRW